MEIDIEKEITSYEAKKQALLKDFKIVESSESKNILINQIVRIEGVLFFLREKKGV